jgi:hypothetical protein
VVATPRRSALPLQIPDTVAAIPKHSLVAANSEHDTIAAIPNVDMLLQLQDKFFQQHQSMLQPSVKDHSSHGKVTKGKWTTKRRNNSPTNHHPTDPSQLMPALF